MAHELQGLIDQARESEFSHVVVGIDPEAVSYTHLDVYKRQEEGLPKAASLDPGRKQIKGAAGNDRASCHDSTRVIELCCRLRRKAFRNEVTTIPNGRGKP